MKTQRETEGPPLADLLERAVAYAQPERLGRLILKSDPQFDRMTAEDASEVIRASLDLGARYAEELAAEHGTRDPSSICARLGIEVKASNDTARYGSVLQYADYRSRPPRIEVYTKSLEGVNHLLEDAEIADVIGLSDASPAFVAHELFHHVDNLPGRVPAKRVRQIVTARLGPWTLRSGVVSAAEIAAGSFAQALLPLPFHLKLLDLLAIYWNNAARAANWVETLAKS